MNERLAFELRRYIKAAQASLQQPNNVSANCKVRYVTLEPFDAYGERFMSMKHYANVLGLYWFIIKESKVTSTQLKEMTETKLKEFEFLNRFINYFPDIVDELNEYGPYEMAVVYAKEQINNVNVR